MPGSDCRVPGAEWYLFGVFTARCAGSGRQRGLHLEDCLFRVVSGFLLPCLFEPLALG